MNIVILGAGDTGAYLASLLSQEEHSITLVDKDTHKLEKVAKNSDIATKVMHASNWKLLEELASNEPDFFLAMTGSDETNLTACALAKNIGYPQTICRIQQSEYLSLSRFDLSRLFYIDHLISPEILAAHEIMKMLISPSDLFTANFAHGAIQLRSFNIPPSWNREKTPIKDLKFPPDFILGLIRREVCGKELIIFPHGEDTIQKKDVITVVGEASSMQKVHHFFSIPEHPIESVVILGGTSVGVHLASLLTSLSISVKFIEKNKQQCLFLAEKFPQAIILHQEGDDLDFLLGEKVSQSSALLCVQDTDEENLLLASLAKEAGGKKVICLVRTLCLSPILEKLQVQLAAAPQVHLSNRILAILHAKNILSISSLAQEEVKVVEIKVSVDSPLIGIPLSDLSSYLPKDLIIAMIKNQGKVMVGKGSCILSPHDLVILITKSAHIHDLQHLF